MGGAAALAARNLRRPGDAARLLSTTAAGRPTLFLAAAFAIYGIADFATYLAEAPGRAEPPFGDFYAFWSFARFVAENPPAAIYDAPTLQTFQQALDPRFHAFYPCPYPPIFLLLLRPLAALPYPGPTPSGSSGLSPAISRPRPDGRRAGRRSRSRRRRRAARSASFPARPAS
jgi:hypothetical protein